MKIRAGLAALLVLGACTHAVQQRTAPRAEPLNHTVVAPRPQRLVKWTGPVEHVFFHTLVIRPKLAFTDDHLADGFRDYFVTVSEFRRVLNELWRNRWSLVDIHDAVNETVRVPPGRKPFVLSVDDVNYYDYSRERGVGWRLVLDERADVKVEERVGGTIEVTDNDIIPMLDRFVNQHPNFSVHGVKGILAPTAYEGFFGARTNLDHPPTNMAATERARAIADQLRETGWIFASHSYGHLDFTKHSIETLTRDTDRWRAAADPILGPTDIFIFPYGAIPSFESPIISMLRDHGFTILCNIDNVPRLIAGTGPTAGVTIMARRHIDGIAFDDRPERLADLFDASRVIDRAARMG